MQRKKTILIYGRSGSGKSYSIAELAEWIFRTLKMKTRLYTADRGGLDVMLPLIDLGVIEVVEIGDTDPWIFLNCACKGMVRDGAGKWVAGSNDNIGMFAFESMRSFAESLMLDMTKKAASNISIGGGGNTAFSVSGDGQSLKISGTNMAMYGVAQARMSEEIWASQRLPAPYILWSSSVSKDEDTVSTTKVLGPDVIGKALTADTPRWFHITLRIDVIPAQQGKPERHLLYLGSHVDANSGNTSAVGNIRRPMDAPKLEQTVLEPASLVKALEILESGQEAAKEHVKKRLGL